MVRHDFTNTDLSRQLIETANRACVDTETKKMLVLASRALAGPTYQVIVWDTLNETVFRKLLSVSEAEAWEVYEEFHDAPDRDVVVEQNDKPVPHRS